MQFDWLLSSGYPRTIHLRGRKQNGFPVTDEQMFVLNEAAASQNIKKATKFCLTVRGGIL